MAKAATSTEMFTSAKLAEKFGVPVGKVKKAITELKIEPDMKKGACAYYSDATAVKIKSIIK